MHLIPVNERDSEWKDLESQQKKRTKHKQMEHKHILDQQNKNFIHRHIEKFREDRLEGEIIKKRTDLGIIREKKQAEQVRKTNMELVKSMRATNIAIEVEKERERHREAEEDRKIEEYGKIKAETLRLRKEMQREEFEKKQGVKQRMMDTMVEKLEDIGKKESLQLEKDLAEIQKRRENRQENKRNRINRCVFYCFVTSYNIAWQV